MNYGEANNQVFAMSKKNFKENEKMKNIKTKRSITLIALFLMLLIAAPLFAIANAHTPPWTIPTWTYVNVTPNPIGVGQTANVVFWVDKMMPTASGIAGDRWINLKVEVTKPDGTNETLGTFTSDPVGGAWTSYTPTEVGTYTFKCTFPGQVLTGSTGTGIFSNSAFINDTYQGSVGTSTLTVQQDSIPGPPSYPLPTEYWTRPIEAQNTEWYQISSNYLKPLGAAYTYGAERLQPEGTSPNSPHIMWTKPIQDGGIVGGNITLPGVNYYTGLSYETKFNSPIIMNGRLYYGLPRSNNGAGGGYVAVDLRSGKTLWWQNYTVNPSFGQLYYYESFNQHGVIPDGYLWATQGTTWMAYNGLDGNWLFNLTSVPSATTGASYAAFTAQTYGPHGEILLYVLNYDTTTRAGWLGLWNNTCEQQGLHGALGTGSAAYQWRPVGKVVNMSRAYSWNVTIPVLPNVGGSPTVRYIIENDMLLGSFGQPGVDLRTDNDGRNPGCTVFAISLKPTSRGQLLWIKDYPAPLGNLTRSFEAVDPVNRVFTMSDKETQQWTGYSMDDGSLLWGPLGNTRALNFYATVGSGGVSNVGFVAYGNLYVDGYGGELFCYSTKTGELLWKYNNTQSGSNTPWGLYPIFTGSICEGKIYVFSNEHSPNVPLYKDEQVRCINATTGEEIWTMNGWAGVGGFADWGWPTADGFITYLNSYDMQLYTLGKGPSATTVEAPMNAATEGSSVVIRGTVTDTAAGTLQEEQKARFPRGVPAVSDDSMSDWMEYVYMQKPRPTNVIGVEVTIDVLDSNGNYRNIGKTTSDANGFYSFQWTPDISGKYTVVATFQGSESYWPSQAETAFAVDEAPLQPTQPPATALPPTEMYILGAAAAIIVAIALVGIVLALMIRKRQ